MDIVTIENGLTVMCLGVSVVFGFLLVLIIAMGIMSKIVAFLDKIYPVAAPIAVPVKKTAAIGDEEIAVAIAAAILRQSR